MIVVIKIYLRNLFIFLTPLIIYQLVLAAVQNLHSCFILLSCLLKSSMGCAPTILYVSFIIKVGVEFTPWFSAS
jgi:hypothetical protein